MPDRMPPPRRIPMPLVTSGRRTVAASILANAADLPTSTAQVVVDVLDCGVAGSLRAAGLEDAQALDVLNALYCPLSKLAGAR